MNRVLNTLVIHKQFQNILKESKRYAGHNKWSNIRHIKQEKDAEKQIIRLDVINRIKKAITEAGGETNVTYNPQLVKVLDYAKKQNVPQIVIDNAIKKAKDKNENSSFIQFNVRGPNNCAFIVHAYSNKHTHMRLVLMGKLKRTRFQLVEGNISQVFDHYGKIVTEIHCDLDKAMEDALNVEAEDVEEYEESDAKYYMFRCEPVNTDKVKTKLENLDYSILVAEEVYEPVAYAHLDEKGVKEAEDVRNKLLEIPDIQEIFHNIPPS